MLQTNEFPRSILSALDALAEIGKAIQEQGRKNQVACPQIFTKNKERVQERQVLKLGDK